MLGIIIVVLSIAAAAYLIYKKYYAPGALLFVGLITLAVVTCISPDPLITGKKATHLAALDVIQTCTINSAGSPRLQSSGGMRQALPSTWLSECGA